MKLRACLSIVFTTLSLYAFAQSDSSFLVKTARSLAQYSSSHPTEKVYLHLDRQYHEPGDTIWFTAYVVAGVEHSLSTISGVLYAELINNKDSVLKRITLQLNNGLAYADIPLPSTYAAGSYRLRAYTNWMRNDDAAWLYNQQIAIGDRYVPFAEMLKAAQRNSNLPSKSKTNAANNIDVQFFPEGGDLVNGLRSKLAVKAVSSNGFGEDIDGIIEDNYGNEVAKFATGHLGMGVVGFTPQTGKTYKAKVTCRDGSVYAVELPRAKDEGFTLTVNAVKDDSVYVKVAANVQAYHKLQNTAFYVIAQQNGNVRYTADARLLSPVFTTAIAKKRFRSGILQFTLFSSTGEPLNERVVFIQNNDQLDVALNADTVQQAWQKMNIGIDAKDKDGNPANGNFSVAVTDEENAGNNETPEENIFTHLLLTSDVKGFIETPNYYFTNVNDETRANLDLLMLTQGYRKLAWQKVLKNDKPALLFQPEDGLSLEGLVMTPSGAPVSKGKVSLTSIAARIVIDTLTGDDGSFKFNNLAFADTGKIIIKALKANNGKNVALYIKQRDYPAIEPSNPTNNYLAPKQNDEPAISPPAPLDTTKQQLLKQVNIRSNKAPKPDRFNNYGTTPEYEVNMGQIKDYNSLKDALAHRIPGMSTDGRGNLHYERAPVLVMINGLRREQSDIDIYNVGDIDNIRIVSATNISKIALLIITTHRFTGRDSIHIKLKEVNIRDKKVEKPGISNHFGTDAPYTIGAERLKRIGPILNPGLASIIPGTFYRDGKIRSLRMPPINPLLHIVLNDHEIPQIDGEDINNYVRTDEVENVKILHGYFYKTLYGVPFDPAMHDEDDIILVTTKQYAGTAKREGIKLKEVGIKSDPNEKYVTTDLPTSLISYKFNGYYKAHQFYAPKYDDPNVPHSNAQPSTVYWGQSIITDKTGHALITFYNNGNKGSYRVVIEGIDTNGNLGRQVLRYKVN